MVCPMQAFSCGYVAMLLATFLLPAALWGRVGGTAKVAFRLSVLLAVSALAHQGHVVMQGGEGGVLSCHLAPVSDAQLGVPS